MTRVRVSVADPGPPEAARELWFDTRRWPTFVDGFGTIVRRDDDWPAAGVCTWDSTPHGGGRTRETVIAPDTVDVETEQLRGTRTMHFADGAVALEFDYQLKRRNPILDLLFIRRALRDSLRRTLHRFAIERRD
jgi:hypothetical protein